MQNMENIDLDINNYDYQDILDLFKLNHDFNKNQLKTAKQTVLSLHPDKSKLDKKFYLFFSKAYKILLSVYEFREKANQSQNLSLPKEEIEYLATKDEYNEKIIANLRENNKFTNNNFNKWFNKMFEEIKLNNDYNDEGYGDWLKNIDNDDNLICNNLNEINEKIKIKKQILRENQLTKFSVINEFNNTSYCDLTNSKPQEYSSGLFSKFQFEDLKRAHEESIVPVTDDDYNKNYNSIDDIKIKRQQQNLEPLSQSKSAEIMNNQNNQENVINSHRAYKLYQQQELIESANKKWWASLKQIK
jgi:hypothetical protein